MNESNGITFEQINPSTSSYNVDMVAQAGYDKTAIGYMPETRHARRTAGGQRKPADSGLPIAPEDRAALKLYLSRAVEAAGKMVSASTSRDSFGLYAASEALNDALRQMWRFRSVKHDDPDWRAILTAALGIIPQAKKKESIETLSTERCRSVHDMVTRCLSLSTKGADEAVEAVRLIEDAGFSPFYAISGDDSDEVAEGS